MSDMEPPYKGRKIKKAPMPVFAKHSIRKAKKNVIALKPVEMAKINIVGLKHEMEKIIEYMYGLGAIEIRESAIPALESNLPLSMFSQIAETLARIENIHNELDLENRIMENRKRKLMEEYSKKEVKEIVLNAEKIISDFKSLKEEKEKDEKELESIENKIRGIRENSLQLINVDLSVLKSKTLIFKLAKVPENEIKKFLAGIQPIEILMHKANGFYICLIALRSDFPSPFIIYPPQIDGKPKAVLEQLEKEKTIIERSIREHRKKMLDKKWQDVYGMREVLAMEYEKAGIASNFRSGKRFFVLTGWIPEKDFGLLKKIERKFHVEITRTEPLENEIPPTVLDTPERIRPFDDMVKFVSLPKYGEFNPSFLMAFFFPFLYGMMLGDAGYGILSIGIAYALRKQLGSFFNVLLIGAFFSILFGFVYDEFFGFTHDKLIGLKLYSGLERLHGTMELFALVLVVGAIHLIFGFVVGAYNEWEHHRKHAYAKLAWALLIIGIFAYTQNTTVGGVLMALSLLALVLTEGLLALIEIPSVVGNILSYARVMAVGLSSVVVALIANEMLTGIVMLPFLIIVHALNTLMGMFESSIQGARLNYVEFFSKFYSGGGKEFKPFKSRW